MSSAEVLARIAVDQGHDLRISVTGDRFGTTDPVTQDGLAYKTFIVELTVDGKLLGCKYAYREGRDIARAVDRSQLDAIRQVFVPLGDEVWGRLLDAAIADPIGSRDPAIRSLDGSRLTPASYPRGL